MKYQSMPTFSSLMQTPSAALLRAEGLEGTAMLQTLTPMQYYVSLTQDIKRAIFVCVYTIKRE